MSKVSAGKVGYVVERYFCCRQINKNLSLTKWCLNSKQINQIDINLTS